MDVDTEGQEAPLTGALTTRSERRLASGHWLLAAAPSVSAANAAWKETGETWLQPSPLFTAVLVPASIVHAATGVDSPEECAPALQEALDGPVFYDPGAFRADGAYVVLLPASAATIWNVPSTTLHAPRALLLVPAPDRCEPVGDRPWWVLPLEGPGELCPPALLASLACLGRRRFVPSGGELE
ncbi:hypothetical protein [Streptomyces sp. H27-H5]|uniref:hypothetical protein n=1 Tax=Streptomyces sp. H27-H5 TaxID=2996460 RepID=UPI0022707195|nr:hypothetical protein [Streptomyces sp. H27-H5]MCY0957761.1 hypothetical protein [Streptomyces sp. H27-H5]